MIRPHVAIIGGGYAGTAQALELLRRGLAVTLIERAPRLARGVAYSTRAPDHLLNVRASGMSAFAAEPAHFASWLSDRGEGGPDDFAPRRSYGQYLHEQLEDAVRAAAPLRIVHGEAVDVVAPATVQLASGERIEADAAILAVGNLPPSRPRLIPPELDGGIYLSDPWSADPAAGLNRGDIVLLIGTGLTAIDAILSLDSAGFSGRILAVSRRGLLPRAHAEIPAPAAPTPDFAAPNCRTLTATIRAEAAWRGWREAVDSLRPITAQLWADASLGERRRFLRHLRPWWDVHRHRIAPQIAARLERLQQMDRLTIAAGRLLSVAPAADASAMVTWRRRASIQTDTATVKRIVNCTGPETDLARAGDPLLGALFQAGQIRADSAWIGLDVDADNRLIDRAGQPSAALFAIGPITRGAFWEIVAVPDIRAQVARLASYLKERLSIGSDDASARSRSETGRRPGMIGPG